MVRQKSMGPMGSPCWIPSAKRIWTKFHSKIDGEELAEDTNGNINVEHTVRWLWTSYHAECYRKRFWNPLSTYCLFIWQVVEIHTISMNTCFHSPCNPKTKLIDVEEESCSGIVLRAFWHASTFQGRPPHSAPHSYRMDAPTLLGESCQVSTKELRR